jgi:GAF domain-containing protein
LSDELRALADEQAALRRVAMLVARGAPPEDVFAAVLEEVRRVLPVDLARMGRYEDDGTLTRVGVLGREDERFPVGTRRMLGGENLSTIVFETGRSGRIDDYLDSASGPLGDAGRDARTTSSVATPIMVEGRLWGVITAGSVQS